VSYHDVPLKDFLNVEVSLEGLTWVAIMRIGQHGLEFVPDLGGLMKGLREQQHG
jgi:hypothetical protein